MEKDWIDLSNKEIDKMQKIAKSAAKLFYEMGYLETSMDDISNAAHLSKGGIITIFQAKMRSSFLFPPTLWIFF